VPGSLGETLAAAAAALATAAASWGCWRLGRAAAARLPRRGAEAVAGGCLLLAASGIVLVSWFPDAVPRRLLHTPAILLEFLHWIPPASAFFGTAAPLVPREATRRGLAALVVLATAVGGLHAWLAVDGATHPGLAGHERPRGRDGIFPQTSAWSCGPASCATLLGLHGIRASEREMAERCLTYPTRGTSWLRFVRGLESKLAAAGSPLVVQARTRATPEAMAAGPFPFLAAIRLNPVLHHAVVVAGRAEGGAWLVADPLGPGTLARVEDAEFRRRFTGEAFWLEPAE
jgi:hypothetical protein